MSGTDKKARRVFNELRRLHFLIDTDGRMWNRFKEWWRNWPRRGLATEEETAESFKKQDRAERGTTFQQLTDRLTAARDNPQQEFDDARKT